MKPDIKTFKVDLFINNKVQTYETSKSEFVFGRSGTADISVQDNGISREHLKIKFELGLIYVLDLGSLNGVYLNTVRIKPNEYTLVPDFSIITFGKSQIRMKVELHPEMLTYLNENKSSSEAAVESFEIITPQVHETVPQPASQNVNSTAVGTPQAKGRATSPVAGGKNSHPPKHKEDPNADFKQEAQQASAEALKIVSQSEFPKNEKDIRMNFKNVGLDLPKYKNPGAHAKEIIKEAEYQKHAIIKSAEVFKTKTINETRMLAKKAAEDAHEEFKRLADLLIDNTRQELKRLRTETDVLLDEKRLHANEEIQKLWQEHEDQIRLDRQKQLEAVEKENKIKLDLSIEKARSEMFSERHKLLTDAENEILQKRRTYQVEFENERNEHLAKIKAYNEELAKVQFALEENRKQHKDFKQQKDDAEIELSKVQSQLKSEKESLEILINSFKETEENHRKIEHDLNHFRENKQKLIDDSAQLQEQIAGLNLQFAKLSEKKAQIEDEIKALQDNLADAKAKAKAEIEAEYANLKNSEAKKFEDFRINELKELQKIRDTHSESIKSFSVDLSQEIATKLELLASQNGYTKFDFEKHFELINSVIQVKSAVTTGSESKHAEQLDTWKKRKRKENFALISQGFAAGLVILLGLQFGYNKLNVDPVQAELARIAAENKEKDIENRYVPLRKDEYYDNYVDAVLYTDQFHETYLDSENRKEWVNHATKYFLRQWKVEEEKVISVISNSAAVVQTIADTIPTMKKTRLKSDLAKLRELEEESIKKSADLLGSNVRYEAYKKIEKEFFESKLKARGPASK